MTRAITLAASLAMACAAWSDGPQDNVAENVRRVPPAGIEVPTEIRRELATEVEALGREIEVLRKTLKAKAALLELLPDVQVYHNAARYALAHDEFYSIKEIDAARQILQAGFARAKSLQQGQHPWTSATGLVVRGYVSKIDGAVQPYGLVVPATFRADSPYQHRLDIWYHGRGEKLTELSFIQQRQSNPGQFTPANGFVLHPYGRYCNANHFAGETDTFEALAHVRRHYAIDENRLVVRGFSMGGAACWHMAVHHAGLWAAAAPGAGFSETPDFLRTFQQETLKPPSYEVKLWHLYDCTDYARNLFNCPVVAYSGEKDRQKQAADMMSQAMAAEGMELTHIIGPGMGHAYHPDSIKEINRRIDAIVARGRDPLPRRVKFTTWTLRYNRMLWVELNGLGQHWERAQVDAEIVDDNTVKLATNNVTGLSLIMPAGLCPLDCTRPPRVLLDGEAIEAARVQSDRSWYAAFHKTASGWRAGPTPEPGLRKKHALQGPIDDAFMDGFVMVRPTGKSPFPKVDKWVAAEMEHAVDHWRRQFRGEAEVRDDVDVSPADIAEKNLILWGVPASNKLLAKIAGDLPIEFGKTALRLGARTWPAERHIPAMIYPNPLNSSKYIVLNSGFTFREYDYLNNARQVPKLPDYAIFDLDIPRTSRYAAGVADAGFFDERWQVSE